MRRAIILLLVLTAICSGCSKPPVSPTPSAERTQVYAGLGLENLEAYHARFEVRFEGDFEWLYLVETRTDGRALEHSLHLEGVGAARNPGDVRLVVEGGNARMRGPGTDDECLQFPASLDLGLQFLTPNDLIRPAELGRLPEAAGSEAIAGVKTTRYSLSRTDLDGWCDLEVGLWLDEGSGAVLRYDLRAAGSDPLFDAGDGVISGQFVVEDVGPQTIEPVAGCEIDLPLPPDATDLIKLPGGLIVFESTVDAVEISAFYQAEMTEAGWDPLEESQVGVDAFVLTYGRNGDTVQINIETRDGGAHVELLPGGEG
jgi:hypothetical protein